MRVVGTIPHPKLTITIFHMNERFILKFEAGPMEQTYKFSAQEVNGVDDLKKRIDHQFIQKVITRFNEMFLDLQSIKTTS